MEGKQPRLVFKNKEEIRDFFQIGENGISSDYHNAYSMSFSFCKEILSIEAELADLDVSSHEKSLKKIKEKKVVILKQMKESPSYLEYLDALKRKHGIIFEEFLTDQGRGVIEKLDEVFLKIKTLCSTDDPEKLDIKTLFSYLEEMKGLIDKKYL